MAPEPNTSPSGSSRTTPGGGGSVFWLIVAVIGTAGWICAASGVIAPLFGLSRGVLTGLAVFGLLGVAREAFKVGRDQS